MFVSFTNPKKSYRARKPDKSSFFLPSVISSGNRSLSLVFIPTLFLGNDSAPSSFRYSDSFVFLARHRARNYGDRCFVQMHRQQLLVPFRCRRRGGESSSTKQGLNGTNESAFCNLRPFSLLHNI